MGLARFITRQLSRPSTVTSRLMNVANSRINRRAVELLDVSPDDRVLDVGFGGGAAMASLVPAAAFVAGIDHADGAVRLARRRFRDEIGEGLAE